MGWRRRGGGASMGKAVEVELVGRGRVGDCAGADSRWETTAKEGGKNTPTPEKRDRVNKEERTPENQEGSKEGRKEGRAHDRNKKQRTRNARAAAAAKKRVLYPTMTCNKAPSLSVLFLPSKYTGKTSEIQPREKKPSSKYRRVPTYIYTYIHTFPTAMPSPAPVPYSDTTCICI